MGNRGKSHRPRHRNCQRATFATAPDDDCDLLPSSAYDVSAPNPPASFDSEEEKEQPQQGGVDDEPLDHKPPSSLSKFHLYQLSVQSPKGDISYLLKFFLLYVGGRMPFHLQEDFCGTALLSTEWIRTDPRRTAGGLDLDLDSLTWCLDNNLPQAGPDASSRIFLFHGNVLHPHQARPVRCPFQHLIQDVSPGDIGAPPHPNADRAPEGSDLTVPLHLPPSASAPSTEADTTNRECVVLPARDIICAFNYSCCCLHKRSDLVLYFKLALCALSKRGGIFVMDLYGGSSSEHKLQLRRRFPHFTYIWEQAEFDIISRKTKISLHFRLEGKQTLRHAFSYSWRLWSLPEIKECLEEAGFKSVHFWIREMPDTNESDNAKEFNASSDIKYEACLSFPQRDAWNAYIVGVAN